jgi:hypothetical protein
MNSPVLDLQTYAQVVQIDIANFTLSHILIDLPNFAGFMSNQMKPKNPTQYFITRLFM